MKDNDVVKNFYEGPGWDTDIFGNTVDALLWEDLRPVASNYVSACRRKIRKYLPSFGKNILDAGSGPIQYPEYLEYSNGFEKRYCVDISQKALKIAKAKLGKTAEFLCASILDLPFHDNYFDATISLHTIYHIAKEHQEIAVRQLIRVTKPGAIILIVYANPDRFIGKISKLLRFRRNNDRTKDVLYYYTYNLGWWNQFSDACDVKLVPWRSIVAQESRRLIPGNVIGKVMFQLILCFENIFHKLAVSTGAYPLIVLTKK